MTALDRVQMRAAFTLCLRNLRGRVGLSQEKLAQACEIDRGYLGQLERGNHSPTLETIYRLLPPLEVNLSEFAKEYEACLRRIQREGAD